MLGMDRPVSRRDFLNGVALAIAGLAAHALLPGQAQAQGRLIRPRLRGCAGTAKRQ